METFEDFAAARGPALLRLAVMLTGNPHDAEDLLQCTFVRALRHWSRVRAAEHPEGYMRRILINEHLSWRRTHQRRESALPSVSGMTVPDASGTVPARAAAWQLLDTLPPRQRTILALRYYEDLSDAQIADLLGCSQTTVRSNACRAIGTLRQALPALDPEALP